VVALLTEAAGDGRLTLGEHADRAGQAYTARTLGELSALTADLAAPGAQPIRLDARRSVAAIFARERRDGRWVVPESLPVTAIFGEVVLDLREALLQSRQVTVFATVIAGHVQLIVPEGVAVEITGTGFLSRRSVRGSSPAAPRPGSAPGADPGLPVIEVRTFALWGTVKAITPRRSRWRGALRRGAARR
jgi:uncharacterized protein DUF1707/cell wall-active antibiotic response 4TMS protein YvqF